MDITRMRGARWMVPLILSCLMGKYDNSLGQKALHEFYILTLTISMLRVAQWPCTRYIPNSHKLPICPSSSSLKRHNSPLTSTISIWITHKSTLYIHTQARYSQLYEKA